MVVTAAFDTEKTASLLGDIDAYLFDLDGVLTPTAIVHMHAWSQLFHPFLAERGAAEYTDADYFSYIDGKPRYDGVQALLESRGIELPYGTPNDAPAENTVCGLGNRKNEVFNKVLDEEGVRPYPASVRLLDALEARGFRVAVVSSSKNAPAVLAAAGLTDRFSVVVDGGVAATLGLPGKPAPDTYSYAADLIGVPAAACAVVEDAESGITAGVSGKFGAVIGVDRGVGADTLRELGADSVVSELDELIPLLSPPPAATKGVGS